MRGRLIIMTLIKPIIDGATVSVSVKAAKRIFIRAITAMETLADRVENDEIDACREVKPGAIEMGAATRQLMTEHARVEELQRKQIGIVHDFAIDFDAARDEIRLRLACLRAAGDG